MKLPISLVIVTFNEEKNIARCIQSVNFADEILILDSGSQDQTREIASQFGATVCTEPWRGFGPQKRRAVELAKNDWILSLDADETLSEALVKEIMHKWGTLQVDTGYLLPRKSFYLGRWILHGGWYPDYQLRLFNRKYLNWSNALIHEKIEAKKCTKFSAHLEHFVFKNISHQVQTNDKYSGLQATAFIKKGGKFSFFQMLIKPFSKFFECYFLKAGFLDGLPGFIIAVGAAYSVFIRWGKIWEIQSGVNKV